METRQASGNKVSRMIGIVCWVVAWGFSQYYWQRNELPSQLAEEQKSEYNSLVSYSVPLPLLLGYLHCLYTLFMLIMLSFTYHYNKARDKAERFIKSIIDQTEVPNSFLAL